jgi:segregation and condensation protein A
LPVSSWKHEELVPATGNWKLETFLPMTEPVSNPAAAMPGEGAKQPKLHGQLIDKLPEDLYIPPDALQVFLEAFEGPLDLLLYLIRRQNLNILDIPVLKITQQYMEYIHLMQDLRWDLAAEYLLMAAYLAEIKSRILLPKPTLEEQVDDPRMDLVRRLQEYERFKSAAENLDKQPRVGREIHIAQARPDRVLKIEPLPAPSLRELLEAFREALHRAELFTRHQIEREPLSVRERMSHILSRLREGPAEFLDLVDPAEGRAGVVVCFLAVLELARGAMLEVVQQHAFGKMLLQVARARSAVTEDDLSTSFDDVPPKN